MRKFDAKPFLLMIISLILFFPGCANLHQLGDEESQSSQLESSQKDSITAKNAQLAGICKKKCEVHFFWCSRECMTSPSYGCHSQCSEIYHDCHCPEGDSNCQNSCYDRYMQCDNQCDSQIGSNPCISCGGSYLQCWKNCDQLTYFCHSDQDCGRNYVCTSSNECIYAKDCDQIHRCPEEYLCYKGHCFAY